MKRPFSFVISFAIAVLCLCGCAGGESSDAQAPSSSAEQTSSVINTQTPESSAETTSVSTSVTTSETTASQTTSVPPETTQSVTTASVSVSKTEPAASKKEDVQEPAKKTVVTKKTAVTKKSVVTKKTSVTKKPAVTSRKTTTTSAVTKKPAETTKPAVTTKPVVTTTAKPEPVPEDVTKSSDARLYYIPKTTKLYDLNKKCVGSIYGYSFYTGHYDPKYEGYVVIDYLYSKMMIPASSVKIQKNAKILPTASIGQMGGRIYGFSACGPAAATILVNSQLGLSWNKDDLLVYCERNRLNDQGSLRYCGGITAPKLIRAINGFSGGKVKAQNLFGRDPASIVKKQLDSGKRSLVVVRYTSYITVGRGGTHFVVVCGYEYIGGVLYFYYADPFYGQGGRSLLRVPASTLAYSMNTVYIEPRCIITVRYV